VAKKNVNKLKLLLEIFTILQRESKTTTKRQHPPKKTKIATRTRASQPKLNHIHHGLTRNNRI
jgi:hypothetical protein